MATSSAPASSTMRTRSNVVCTMATATVTAMAQVRARRPALALAPDILAVMSPTAAVRNSNSHRRANHEDLLKVVKAIVRLSLIDKVALVAADKGLSGAVQGGVCE